MKIDNQISVPNRLANDSTIAGIYHEVEPCLKDFLKRESPRKPPLLVCSGGTSSRCAAENYWTLDLRKNYQSINYEVDKKEIEIGAGIKMSDLLQELKRYGRTFPTGLSGAPGLGYILTGGISPLSRSMGLAIDQIVKIKGFWGNGKEFELNKPNLFTGKELKIKWKGLCGAAPFLAIVTNVKLKTFKRKPLKVLSANVSPETLIELIQLAEYWSNSCSLHWIWGEEIRVYCILDIDCMDSKMYIKEIKKIILPNISLKDIDINGIDELPEMILNPRNSDPSSISHSEVIGLLGNKWENNCSDIVNSIANLIKTKPFPNCYIASQQLGGMSTKKKVNNSSFIHRDAIWKTWITAAWEPRNSDSRSKSLCWLGKAWDTLDPMNKGIHLAQMHQHLALHQKEVSSAFKGWLPGLKDLKSNCDPRGILPRL